MPFLSLADRGVQMIFIYLGEHINQKSLQSNEYNICILILPVPTSPTACIRPPTRAMSRRAGPAGPQCSRECNTARGFTTRLEPLLLLRETERIGGSGMYKL